MRLDRPFIRLPIRFDQAGLEAEVAAIPAKAWRPHPEGAPGNSAVPLVCHRGDPDDERPAGPMAPAPVLAELPAIRATMAALRAPIGRSRLMRVESRGRLGSHVDTNRYWQEHLRVHVPVVTDPSVRFTCGDERVHMAPGEAWVFDTWREHGVENPAGHDRVHLVIDTVGSSALWRAISAGAEQPSVDVVVEPSEPLPVAADALRFEIDGGSPLATPWQQELLGGRLIGDVLAGTAIDRDRHRVVFAIRRFLADWRAEWFAAPRTDRISEPFVELGRRLRRELAGSSVALANGITAERAAEQLLIASTMDPPASRNTRHADGEAVASGGRRSPHGRRIERPIFIVSPPRSGSSLLFEALGRAKDLYTIGGESHRLIESIDALHPAQHDWHSNALAATDATPPVVRRLDESFAAQCRDRDGLPPVGRAPIRLLEKTPKNALRVPFLSAAYPDASFVYLHRPPEAAISSMIHAWISGRFVTYPQLPGWPGTWSLLMVPGWRGLLGESIDQIAAAQWATTTEILLDDLAALDRDRWCIASYERLVADPDRECRRLAERLDLTWDRPLIAPLPPSRTTLDPPDPDKWRRDEDVIDAVRPTFGPVADRASALLNRTDEESATAATLSPARTVVQPPTVEDPQAVVPGASAPALYSSVFSASFGALISHTRASLIVTTYQAGRVVIVRTGEDGGLNTHLRAFRRPMGVAARRGAIALGTDQSVIEFRDQPALAARLPGGAHDACYVPRRTHVTGDISVHEMAWSVDGQLWIVNTRFSCLATLDSEHSFVPRWRPAFITDYGADDRCHLNGLAMVEGRPRYVTAMAMSDEPQGWRRDKVGGGIVIDITDDAIVATGLTMPHSPRWHRDQLWVLDSGHGYLSRVDFASGRAEPVVRLPGFTRGLVFVGGYALVGLSKVREHVFAGLPLAEHVAERQCGVWIVDVERGETVGMLRFDGEVDEVFDVQVLRDQPYPELLELNDPLAATSFVVPNSVLGPSALATRRS
jgi:uncharacterized protein (TIGR03032 family)